LAEFDQLAGVVHGQSAQHIRGTCFTPDGSARGVPRKAAAKPAPHQQRQREA